MPEKTENPRSEDVREDWSRRGRHWDSRADEVAAMAARFNAPLIEAAKIEPGLRVLDLATGAGEPMTTVAEMVGASGAVVASDLVPEMLEGARRRVAEKGLKNVSFKIADMCGLAEEDASFDRVMCRFGIMFVPDPVKAASEAARVLKPGGRAAYMVWGPRDDTTMFTVFAEVAEEFWGLDDPLIDLSTMCRMGEAGTLSGILEAGGLGQVEEQELRFTPKVPGDREFWHPQIDMSLGPKLDQLGAEERAAVAGAVRDKFNRYLKDGEYHMTAHVRIGSGVKS